MRQPLLFDLPIKRRRKADPSPGVTNRNEVYRAVVEPTVTKAQLRVLEAIRGMGGATIEEAAMRMGKAAHQISGRFSELRKQGLIATKGEKRVTSSGNPAVVWYASETGAKS